MYRYTEAHTSIQLCTTQTETLIHMHIFDTDTQITNPPTYFLKLLSTINTASTSQLCPILKTYIDSSKPILGVPGICKIRETMMTRRTKILMDLTRQVRRSSPAQFCHQDMNAHSTNSILGVEDEGCIVHYSSAIATELI